MLISNLDKLDFHGNMLDGTLDLEFMLLSSASYVDLSDNMLLSSDSGKFLPQISESIKYMNLSHNQLTVSLVGGLSNRFSKT